MDGAHLETIRARGERAQERPVESTGTEKGRVDQIWATRRGKPDRKKMASIQMKS